jgi:cellulose binding protein with CBM2 domain
MSSHDRNSRRRAGHAASRRHVLQTQLLLDLSYAEEVPLEPLGLVGRSHARKPRRRIVAIVAAAVLVAVTILGTSLGVQSLLSGGSARNPNAFHGAIALPKFPSASPMAKRVPARHPKPRPKPSPRTVAPTHTARPAPAPTVSPTPAPAPIVVTFRIDNNWGSGFTAEVDVTNNESTPIWGWQIVVALPQDQFTGWWNANGHASNGILLLTQPPWQGPVAAHGGTLRVYFNVNGWQTTPTACAFNGITCGLAVPHRCCRRRVKPPEIKSPGAYRGPYRI